MKEHNSSPLPRIKYGASSNPSPLAGEGKKNRKQINSFLLFEIGIEFAVIFALPLIGAVYLGKWLDAEYGTKFIIVICILIALALSWYMIYRKIKQVKNLLK